ncbi:MAG TPA: hypothetical protein VLE49_03850 [Anaerolineales bacterium]|nr:hypothetical protein [Anaerolineales bacterium]
MRRYDPRLIIGVLLIFGGLLALLDQIGIITNASGIFWGLVLGAGGLVFLYMLINDRNSWWAAFPAFTLLALSLASFLPRSLQAYDGLLFFAGISLGFWWVYFTGTAERWWAIIPAGVLLTLGLVSAVEDASGMETGGLFFLGLGITFLLVAVLPGGGGRSWAFIPGAILVFFGALLGIPGQGVTDYLVPTVLILLGGYFVFRFFKNRPLE